MGLAYSAYAPDFVRGNPGHFDYLEVPFEVLHYSPRPIDLPDSFPTLLHCASLSMAGSVPPSQDIVDSVSKWTNRTATPWLGEHLAFVVADPGREAEALPYDVGYAVNPPTNMETVAVVAAAVQRYGPHVGVPILLENVPVYFVPPGSTMTPTEFTNAIFDACSAGMLLDLAHFFITCRNLGQDPFDELVSLRLDRITEVHISGAVEHEGLWWDEHTVVAPEEIHALLRVLLSRTSVAAITLEYNWNGSFPAELVLGELERVRRVLREVTKAA